MQIICYAMDLDEAHLPGRQVAQTALISPKNLQKLRSSVREPVFGCIPVALVGTVECSPIPGN